MIRAVALFLALPAAAPQEAQPEKFPASKHLWMRWKPGTRVTYALTQQVPTGKHEGDMVFALREVTAEGYVITVRTRLPGFEREQSEKESVPRKAGEEKITVGGKEQTATVWKSSGRRDEGETERRAWLVDGLNVPVKTVSKTKGEEFELAAESLKDEVAVAGKKVPCVKLSGKMNTPQGPATITVWMTDQVPGGIARMETSALEGELRVTLEASEIQEGK
jgi:hypothetical protein